MTLSNTLMIIIIILLAGILVIQVMKPAQPNFLLPGYHYERMTQWVTCDIENRTKDCTLNDSSVIGSYTVYAVKDKDSFGNVLTMGGERI